MLEKYSKAIISETAYLLFRNTQITENMNTLTKLELQRLIVYSNVTLHETEKFVKANNNNKLHNMKLNS